MIKIIIFTFFCLVVFSCTTKEYDNSKNKEISCDNFVILDTMQSLALDFIEEECKLYEGNLIVNSRLLDKANGSFSLEVSIGDIPWEGERMPFLVDTFLQPERTIYVLFFLEQSLEDSLIQYNYLSQGGFVLKPSKREDRIGVFENKHYPNRYNSWYSAHCCLSGKSSFLKKSEFYIHKDDIPILQCEMEK